MERFGKYEGKIFLGDQSPSMGGLLRLDAVRKSYNVDAMYFIQDADMPWLVAGTPLAAVTNKPEWPSYWATAVRVPFSFNTPAFRPYRDAGTNRVVQDHSDTVRFRDTEAIRSSIGAPMGLLFLTGQNTPYTFYSERDSAKLKELSTQLLLEEAKWAKKVAELMGDIAATQRATDVIAELSKSHMNVYESTEALSKMAGADSEPVGSMIELFKEDPVMLSELLPHKSYWVISPKGYRNEWDGSEIGPGHMLLPKGEILPLELAAKGFTIGFTGMSYLQKMLELRDSYVPDLKVKMLQIAFTWNFLGEHPLKALENFYVKKKSDKMGYTVTIDQVITEGILRYWTGRPTSISWLILGGQIDADFTYSEY